MKLKALVLTAGLLALGANAAWSLRGATAGPLDLPTCKTNLDGQARQKGDKCTSKSYKFNYNSKCTCPGDKPQQTKKCEYNPSQNAHKKYSCEVP